MIQDVVILRADGTIERSKEEIQEVGKPTPPTYVPAQEDRLSALEAAMLALMEV